MSSEKRLIIFMTLLRSCAGFEQLDTTACQPYDRDYCNNRGYCDSNGNGCECDDYLHYWPSEQCSIWHSGRELESGQYCYPGTVDYYCSWLGNCTEDGMSCDCFDSEHRTSVDRCLEWYSVISPATAAPSIVPATLAPTAVNAKCSSGDRDYCNNRGYCDSNGNGCECDDYLHYWPSEQCSIWHSGRELESGQYCYPGTVDYYCSWLGTCTEDGMSCDCFDSEHRTSVDRCLEWYITVPTPSPSFVPPSLPPDSAAHTLTPTSLMPTPMLRPTNTPSVVLNQNCFPGDRDYCNNRGYCDSNGNGCECDDYLHYWPSEQCSIWHSGRELESGQYCYPGTVDYYCSWLGTCTEDGMSCDCFDSEHRTSADRCAIWSPAPPISSPAPTNLSCFPGDRYFCSNRGYCNDEGSMCVCDDPLHFWSSDRCENFHFGPELDSLQCCFPNSTDFYCSWLGSCDENGTHCLCDDPDHRLPSERCENWHAEVNRTPSYSTCPPYIDIEEVIVASTSNGNTNNPFSYMPLIVGGICLLVLSAAFLVYRCKSGAHQSPDTAKSSSFSSSSVQVEDDGFSLTTIFPSISPRVKAMLSSPRILQRASYGSIILGTGPPSEEFMELTEENASVEL